MGAPPRPGRRRALRRRDPLTGLRDRDSLLRRGQALLDTAAREQRRAVVALGDVDRLKQVNDALGHAAGDRLLVETAVRLRRAAGPEGVLARVGGDEFALVTLLEAGTEPQGLSASILALLGEPVHVDGVEVPTGASVGVALARVDGTRVETLLAAADQLMYARKGGGPRPGVVTLSGRAAPADDDLAADLARALGADGRASTTSRRSSPTAPSSASRRCCAGSTRGSGRWVPPGSCRSRPATAWRPHSTTWPCARRWRTTLCCACAPPRRGSR